MAYLRKLQLYFANLINRFSYLHKIGAFLKIKTLKFGVKLILLTGVLWFFSGSWLGEKLMPLINIISGGTYSFLKKILDFTQILAQGLLILVLVLTILGKSIWKGFYVLISLGLLIAILQRFVF